MLQNKILLWLDDNRDPIGHPYINYFWPNYVGKNEEIIWVKNYNEFITWIKENGMPSRISFDHDLADEHYAPEHRYGDYNVWASEQEFKEKTGMDCAKWLVDYCLDNNEQLPIFIAHSANPSGTENIRKILWNFLKFQDRQKTDE